MTTAFITGSTGIALAAARGLLTQNIVDEVIFLSRNAKRAQESIRLAVEGTTGTAKHITCDLSQYSNTQNIGSLNEVCTIVENWEKPIKCFVNCAGILGPERLLVRGGETLGTNIEDVFKVNLFGPIILTKSIAKQMLKVKGGDKSIVNVGSVVASLGNSGQTVYSASKAGLTGFSRSLAQELGSRNIRVNTIEPGFIRTEMTKHLNETDVLKKFGGSCLNRFGTAEEVASLIVFLSSDKSSFITGQTIRIDGGM